MTIKPDLIFVGMPSAGSAISTWSDMKNDDAGEPIEIVGSTELHVQVVGSADGAFVSFEGSNFTSPKDDQWSALVDADGLAIDIRDGDPFKVVYSVGRWCRPKVSGGGDGTSISVLARRAVK